MAAPAAEWARADEEVAVIPLRHRLSFRGAGPLACIVCGAVVDDLEQWLTAPCPGRRPDETIDGDQDAQRPTQ